MKRTKIFTEDSAEKLQRGINNWLSKNRAIGIIRTDMQVTSIANKAAYSFYILYETLEASAEVAVSAQMESILTSEEIQTEVKPENVITPDKDVYNTQ
ncbi:MAG: hypothetical protein JWQ38_602 [Flavipsychrobacter sp.]|nr:hypothetical protein [Flavipsychrobacter sp.]